MRALRVLLCAVAVLIVVAIGLLSLAAHRRPPQNTLLLHATQVRTPGNGFPLTYAWLTDRDAVFLWDDRRTILAPLHNPRWMKVDTVTGSTTPMPAMDQLFASTAPAFGVQANMISPDGKRALWIGTKNGAPVWHTARLDGSHLTIEPAQITTQMVVLNDRVAWASDSRHWIEVTFTQGSHAPNVHLNDADAPGASATIRPSGSFALDSTYSTHALGTVAGNRILLESTTIVKRTSKT